MKGIEKIEGKIFVDDDIKGKMNQRVGIRIKSGKREHEMEGGFLALLKDSST